MQAHRSRKIGDIEVIALVDGRMTAPNALFPLYDPDQARDAAQQAGVAYDGAIVDVAINAFVIRTGGRTLLVDAGAPPGYSDTSGYLKDSMAAAGIAPGDIDTLAMTHLHIDHVGIMADAEGKAAFPNAQLVSGAGDWDYFHDDSVFAAGNDRVRNSLSVSRRMLAPYADRRRDVQGEAEVAPGVTMVPLPGHTPGHSGILIADGGDQLLIWGDVIHAEAFQLARPDWSVRFDVDQDAARATRVKLFDRVATDGLRVTGPHVRFPGFGRVERMQQGYRLVHED